MSKIQYTKLSAYSHPSTYGGFEDTHCFVLASTGEKFGNCGGIYTSEITLVSEGLAYRTWLNKFMPNQTTSVKETGIQFGFNGVCHTYAMREMLLCSNEKNIAVAKGDDLCTLYYGKYGTGLRYLEQRLRESYNEACQSETIPKAYLDKVIQRIYNTVDEETEAWIFALKTYVNIDVLEYFKSENDMEYLKNRVKQLMNKREALFETYFDYTGRYFKDGFTEARKSLYMNEFKDYVYYLSDIGYFTRQKADEFYASFKAIIEAHGAYYRHLAMQLESSQ